TCAREPTRMPTDSPTTMRSQPAAPARVTVIGDALIDELVDDQGTLRVVGGSGLNVAIGLSILGVPATLIAMVGDDADGQLVRSHLAAYDVGLIPTISPLGTGIARSERRGGEPSYSFNAPMLNRALAFDGPQRRAIQTAEVVAVSGFPLDDDAQRVMLRRALGETAAVSAIDPNPRAGMLREAAGFARALEQLGDTMSLLKLGDDDAQLLYGVALSDVIPALRQSYPRILATEGRAGAAVHVGAWSTRSPARARPDSVIDTMGAGDAVFATILSEIATTKARGVVDIDAVDWELALRRAMDVAAATVAHAGALLRLPSVAR